MKYTEADMTLIGYDRDGDKLWQASDRNIFVTMASEGPEGAVRQSRALSDSPHLDLESYIDNYGPITKEPK